MPLSSRIPAMVSSALFVCVIQYAPGAWANVGGTVVISDQTDCSDGHQSAACGWDGMPDLSPSNGGGGIGGDGGGGSDGGRSEAPAKRTPQQKAADAAECEKQKNAAVSQATIMYQSNMSVCASMNSSWYAYLHQQWLSVAPLIFGYPSLDCASTNTRAFDDAQLVFKMRYDECFKNAMKD